MQRYATHHDYGHTDRQLACGPRILTFFLYLSDVEEGGETAFPTLDIAVTPKKGSALLWPSTLDSKPDMQEPRTQHEARAVLKGVKYAGKELTYCVDLDYYKNNILTYCFSSPSKIYFIFILFSTT